MSTGSDHRYAVSVKWTGNRSTGTSEYRAYGRDHEIGAPGKETVIAGSSAAVYRGDAKRYNPEELLVAALSTCHMLWFLHLCADAGVVVTGYEDEASGTLRVNSDSSGQFSEAVLRPSVQLQDESQRHLLQALHERAHDLCYIARSVNFPVRCEQS